MISGGTPVNDREIEQLAKRLREAAAAAGTYVVETLLQTDRAPACPRVLIEPETAVELIQVVRPQVLYLSEELIDIAEFIAEVLEDLELPANDNPPAALMTAAQGLKGHEGKVGRIYAQFMVGPVLHWTGAMADWLANFEDNIKQISEELIAIERGKEKVQTAKEGARIEEFARKLAVHSAFNFGRSSAAKRLILAKAIFPEEEQDFLSRVVELAEQIDWLTRAGVPVPGRLPIQQDYLPRPQTLENRGKFSKRTNPEPNGQ
jgi:hypothetical protein